jgi:alanine racemase
VENRLNLLVENTEAVGALHSSLTGKVGIYIKIDVGYGRTGIPARHTDRIDLILMMLKTSDHIHFLGFLSHAGHSYHCHSEEDINEVFINSIYWLSSNKSTSLNFRPCGYPLGIHPVVLLLIQNSLVSLTRYGHEILCFMIWNNQL